MFFMKLFTFAIIATYSTEFSEQKPPFHNTSDKADVQERSKRYIPYYDREPIEDEPTMFVELFPTPSMFVPMYGTKKFKKTTQSIKTHQCSGKCPYCPTPYPTIWKSDGKTLLDPSYGRLLKECKSNYIISKEEVTFEDAHVRCCALGMTLWNAKHKTIRCVSDALRKAKYPDATVYADTIWTGGYDLSCRSNEKLFKWCGDHTDFASSKYWNVGEPSKINEDFKCIAYDIQNLYSLRTLSDDNIVIPEKGMTNARCSRKYKYICEAPSTVAPSVTTINGEDCVQNIEDNAEVIKFDQNKKEFTFIGSDCGSVFAIKKGFDSLSFHEAQGICLGLQMNVLTFESKRKQECFTKAFQVNMSDSIKDESRNGDDALKTWTSGRTYFVEDKDEKQFDWCGTRGSPDRKWFKTKDDLTADPSCLSYSISWDEFDKNRYLLKSLVLAENKCDDNIGSLVCESKVLETPSCYRSDICKKTECVRDDSIYRRFINNNKVPKGFECLNSNCDDNYIISKAKTTFDDAADKCCKLGLKLLSVTSNKKRKRLKKIATELADDISNNDLDAVYVWSSAKSIPGCEDHWYFCEAGKWRTINQIEWEHYEPDNKDNNEYCAVYDATSYAMSDVSCTTKHRFICEV